MSSSQFQLDVDDQLLENVRWIYFQLGLNLETAIQIFLKRSVQARGLPFSMQPPKDKNIETNPAILAIRRIQAEAVRNGTSEMTLDEINAEIDAVRQERLARKREQTQQDNSASS